MSLLLQNIASMDDDNYRVFKLKSSRLLHVVQIERKYNWKRDKIKPKKKKSHRQTDYTFLLEN